MAFDCMFYYFSVHCEEIPIKRKFTRSNRNVWPLFSQSPMFYLSNAVKFFSLLDKSLSKAFAISEEDSVCPKAMICSTDTSFLDYLSNDKAGHSGKTMLSGVRKRQWHKLC